MTNGRLFLQIPAILATLAASGALADEGADGRIVAAARNSYTFRVHLKEDPIQVTSKGGRVTLTGTVANELHRTLAEETVSDLPGVTSVDNQLAIQVGAPAPASDAWLALKIRTALLYHRAVNSSATRVEVRDGVATLSGEAASSAQKELTAEVARDIDGVREVRNELKVVSSPGAKSLAEKIDDASVTAQVKAVLLGHRGTRMLATKVKTHRGVVTLGGAARTQAERELVARLVRDVKGVRGINNRMTVAP